MKKTNIYGFGYLEAADRTGEILDMDRKGLRQVHGLLAAAHHFLQAFLRPAVLAPENDLGQREGVGVLVGSAWCGLGRGFGGVWGCREAADVTKGAARNRPVIDRPR